MTQLAQAEIERLFALDKVLRAEADHMLAESGIGAILAAAGYEPVGSYIMRTMIERDLDFERAEESPDRERHWEVGTRLAKTGWCIRLDCHDHYREGWYGPGLYWGLRAADPARQEPARQRTAVWNPTVWKIDMWSVPPKVYEQNQRRRQAWMSSMTEEKRARILAFKESLPDYGRTIVSVHIYEAVLEHAVRELEQFHEWWRGRYGEK